jgi:hypothetical protein
MAAADAGLLSKLLMLQYCPAGFGTLRLVVFAMKLSFPRSLL